jgi:hypothetical protein
MIVGCIPDRVPATPTGPPTLASAPALPTTTDGPAAPGATPRPSRGRPLNVSPRATGAPSRAFAEFLARVNDDRTTVDRLDGALQDATDARDLDAVHRAAVAILDLVDVEQAWLDGHPPADCYAGAYASATAMLEDLGTAAGRFVDWSAAGGGLDGLVALGRAADAAQTAQDALMTFGTVLGGTACPA